MTPWNIRYEINNCKARARSQVIIEAILRPRLTIELAAMNFLTLKCL